MACSAPSAVLGPAAALLITVPCLAGTWALMRHGDFSVGKGSSWKGTLAKLEGGPQGGRTRDSSYEETGTEVRDSWAKCPWSQEEGTKAAVLRHGLVAESFGPLVHHPEVRAAHTWSVSSRGSAWLTALCSVDSEQVLSLCHWTAVWLWPGHLPVLGFPCPQSKDRNRPVS